MRYTANLQQSALLYVEVSVEHGRGQRFRLSLEGESALLAQLRHEHHAPVDHLLRRG